MLLLIFNLGQSLMQACSVETRDQIMAFENCVTTHMLVWPIENPG
jgi:hypothetical protein